VNFIRLLPVFISCLLLAAHFYRAGQLVLVSISLLMILLLAVRQSWVPRLVQMGLLLGGLEWLRTLYFIAQLRIDYGMPWTRLAMILGSVALFTALSALVFKSHSLRRRYLLQHDDEATGGE
jgi:hypothetical protein